MLDICDRYKVTNFVCSPVTISKLLQSKKMKLLSSLEVCMVGGSVVSKHLCEAIRPYLPNGIMAVYGTSEGDIVSASFEVQRNGSAGQLTPNVQMKIINEAGENLGPNEIGEICFKPAVSFSGYFDDPEETNETLKNGWMNSGDVGYFDEDGFLFVIDRKRDVLIYNDVQVICLIHVIANLI